MQFSCEDMAGDTKTNRRENGKHRGFDSTHGNYLTRGRMELDDDREVLSILVNLGSLSLSNRM